MQYAFNMGGAGTLTPRVDYMYQSKVYFDIQNIELASQGAYDVVNARLLWSAPSNKWSSALSVSNLSNKAYYLNMYNIYNSGLGSLTGQPAPPREWFWQIKRKF